MFTSARVQFPAWFLQVQTPGRSGGCESENHVIQEIIYLEETGPHR